MSYSVDSVFKAIHSVADLGEGPGRPAPPPSPYFGAKSIYQGLDQPLSLTGNLDF